MPQFAPLLLFEESGVGDDNVGVPVEAHGVGLADENPSESPAVGGMVVVD